MEKYLFAVALYFLTTSLTNMIHRIAYDASMYDSWYVALTHLFAITIIVYKITEKVFNKTEK